MWILLALLTAICTALRDAASKHATRDVDPIVIAFALAAIPAVLLGALVLARGAGTPGPGFGPALAVSGGINAVATPLIVHALKRSDLSLVAPLRSLTPLFMLGTAAVVLGERPSSTGAIGVAVIVAGAYLLNGSRRAVGPLAPLRSLLGDPGARLMLLVAVLYSISATYDKVGTQASSPLVWAASVQAMVGTLLAPVAAWRWGMGGPSRRSDGRPGRTGQGGPGTAGGPRVGGRWTARPLVAIAMAGTLAAIAAVAQMTALTMAFAAYVIAVKRTSTLWGVLLGYSLFREERVGERLLGAGVMLAGFLLVTMG